MIDDKCYGLLKIMLCFLGNYSFNLYDLVLLILTQHSAALDICHLHLAANVVLIDAPFQYPSDAIFSTGIAVKDSSDHYIKLQ